MKKKSTSQSAFFNLRVLAAMLVGMTGVSLALFAANPLARATGPSPASRTKPVKAQKYNPSARFVDFQALPPGFDCSKIHDLHIDTMENFAAQRIMIACGQAEGGKPSATHAFAKLVKSLLPHPLAYGATDVDVIAPQPETGFPSITQSETYTLASPEDPNTIVVAYNDSSGAGGNPQNYADASVSTDGGTTFTRLTPNPFASAGANYGDPVVLYHQPSHTWFTVWLTP